MCLGTPTVQQAPQQVLQPQAPPPPPTKDPDAPVIDPEAQKRRDMTAAQRKGTSIFRNDLAIPSAGVGTGLNIG